MSYSKIDTAGIEYDVFVTQEIVTADSTYRIMLSAIDSVSFVQPEIKINPRLRDMRKEGMLAYLIQKDEETMTLTFSGSLPESLRPKVDDVLVDFSPEDLGNSFGGKVKNVSASGNITVVCDHLESVHDIYEQYVTVEQYGKDDEGNLVRRRVAGMPEMTIGTFPSSKRHKSEGSVEFNLFNFALSGHYPVYSSPEGDVNISIDADVNVKMDVKAVWDFPMFGPDYLGITTTLNNDIGLGFTLDGKINDIYPLGLVPGGGFPVPANMPLFVINFGPDIFIGGDYHAKLNFQTPKFKGKLWGKLEFAGDFSTPKMSFGRGTPPGEQEPDLAKEADNNNWSGSIEFNGYEQCGVKTEFSFGASKLLSWALNTKVDFTTYIGPKVSGALNFSISNVVQDQMSAYNLLKDTKLTFSPISASYSAEATLGTLFSGQKKWTLADGSWNLLGDIDLFLFPEFEVETEGEGLSYDATRGLLTARVTPSRNIIWPVTVGYGIFKGGKLLETHFTYEHGDPLPEYSQFNSQWKERKTFMLKTYTKAGKYEVRPVFKVFGINIIASPAKSVTVPGTFISVSSDSLRVNDQGIATNPITVESNCDQLAVSAGGLEKYIILSPSGEGLWTLEYKSVKQIAFYDEGFRSFELIGTKTENGTTIKVKENMRLFYDRNNSNMPDKGMDFQLSDSNGTFLWCDNVPAQVTKNGNVLHVEYVGEWPTYDNNGVTGHAEINMSFDMDCDKVEELSSMSLGNMSFDTKGHPVSNGHFEASKYYDAEEMKDHVDHFSFTIDGPARYVYDGYTKRRALYVNGLYLYFEK
jgi:hypothetical protein